MQRQKTFYRGGANYLSSDSIGDILLDTLDATLYNNVKPTSIQVRQKDLQFEKNENFWMHIIENKAYVDQYVVLFDFILTEWIPISPGLFYTESAKLNRTEAQKYLVRSQSSFLYNFPGMISNLAYFNSKPNADDFPIELDPRGKESMVLGGIGTLRLLPKKLAGGERFFICGATSNGVCHEGLPVILNSDLYNSLITELKEKSGLRCNIIGKLCILPTDDSPIRYDRRISKYCIWVEEIKKKGVCFENQLTVSVAITFSVNLKQINQKLWFFITFNPDKKDRNLISSVEWLNDYAVRYSGVKNPLVLCDFDEYKQHFDKTEFSLKDIVNGKIDFVKLAQYEEFINFKIVNVMGDYFSNISNATIVNKSVVQNAFNKVKETIDEDTAAALAQIAEHVEKSGNKEAGEVFNAFNEELQKLDPKKSLLKSFWTGLTSLLPTVSAIAGIAEKVIKMIG